MEFHSPARTIAVVSPSGIVDLEGLHRAVEIVRGWGHEVVLGAHVGAVHRYTAGTTEQRSADLRWAFQDSAVDVVWMARGGFGIQHCLPSLEPAQMLNKMVIGCSDATALLHSLHLHGHSRLFHGPFLDTLAETEPATREHIQRWLLTPDARGGFDLAETTDYSAVAV